MKADKSSSSPTYKEVTMLRRFIIVAIVVAAILVVAAPAMAFNGYRDTYVTSDFCSICHKVGQPGDAPKVYDEWQETKHAVAGADGQATRLPYGSSCGGCHTSNYDPSKVVPTPTATTVASPSPTATNVGWGAVIPDPFPAQAAGVAPMSENFVGCSSCHYGATTGGAPQYGNDPNDTAHMAPNANLANAAICGQCHSRYSYTVDTYPVASVPYVTLNGSGSPIPNAKPTTLLQPQYAIGFKMLGEPASWIPAPLSSVLNVAFPGWTPTPNPSATSAPGLMKYWQTGGVDTPWVINGHDGSATQYTDWSSGADFHNKSLDALKALMGPNPPATCLKCHSADYIIAPDNAKPTGAQAKYGITCVGCHTPHEKGTAEGIWDTAFTPQLRTDGQKTLCVTCHNGEIPEGTTASPGAEIHHPMKEMMDGYGAIDVAAFPSVHKGKCVQCHMPPTTISRGDIQLGANHTFKIIMPTAAAGVDPAPLRTTTPTPSASPVVELSTMPYSACTTCHSRPGDDAAVWLQDTIDQRQDWTHAKVDEIWAELEKAAGVLGYKATADDTATMVARNALVALPSNTWTTAERLFLSGFTNVEFVQSEGSFGLHNWDYSRAIVNSALLQAKSAATGVVVRKPWVVTFKMSKTTVKVGGHITFSGTVKTSRGVAGAGSVKIMKRVKGVWKVRSSHKLNASGNFSVKTTMDAKGTFYMRALMPSNIGNLTGYSTPNKKLVVN
jgi:plastocyanin